MFKTTIIGLLALLLVTAAGCGSSSKPPESGADLRLGTSSAGPYDTVYQVSTINALLQGVYDGDVSCGQLQRQGNLGLGTFDNLDGEMVVLDGQVWQVRADGTVHPAAEATETPFATVVNFRADETRTLAGAASLAELQRQLDGFRSNPNLFYAFRIDGRFPYLKTRSVPRQERPFPPLAEVTGQQPTFEFQNVAGTLVGFWCPAYVQNLNVPGYHLHFISNDRQIGGHLLECQLESGAGQVDALPQFHLMTLQNEDFGKADLAGDRSRETEKVEK